MAMMKFKNSNGEWMSIPAFRGEPGKDGAVQYKAGDGIKIENDTITAEVTKDYIDGKLEDLADIGFTPEISESLPTENIDGNTIYMIPSQDGKGDNIYEEWMYINNKWEMIGSTSVDLTDYYTKDIVDDKIANVRLEREDIPIYHIYGELYVSTSLNTISNTSELGVKITELMQQIYDNRNNHRIVCIIWHNTQVQAPKPTLSIKTYVDTYNMYSTSIPVYTSASYYSFSIMTPTISNGVISWSNNYNATLSVGDVLQSSTVLTKSNTNVYTPSKDYNPATKKYVDDECVRATNNAVAKVPSAVADKTFQIPTGEQITVSTNYVVENISTTYGFALNASGFYESNNKGKSSSYALCKVTFNLSDAISLPITLINYGEAKYDYGIFSEIDKELSNDNGADTTNVFRAYNGANDSSKDEQTLTYNMPAGEHFIYIKYRKDNSSNSFSDSLQFKIPAEITTEKLKDFAFASTEYVNNALANVPQGSGDAKGFYTYKVDLGNIGFAGEIDDYGWITHMVTDKCKTEINDLINKMLTGNIGQPLVVIENTNAEADLKSMLLFGFDCNYDPATMQNLDFTLHGVVNYIGSATGSQMMKYENAVMLAGSGIVTDGVWDANMVIVAVTTQQSLTTDNQMEYVPTGDYNPATKKYVDDAVAGAKSEENNPGLYSLNVGLKFNGESPFNYTDADIVERGRAIIQDAYDRQFPTIGILLNGKRTVMFEGTSSTLTSNKLNSYTFNGYYTADPVNYDLLGVVLYISGSWSGETFTCKSVSGRLATSKIRMTHQSDVLIKTNTTSYTPTGSYHPATKKYVDDAIAGVSGGITSESDPIFSASEAAKITSTDTANWNSKVDINAVNNAINTTLSSKSYLTSEKDPTVPSWAKQPNKPTYTASEVGALPASTVIPTVPSKLSGFTDDLGTSPKHSHSQYLTAHQDISGKQNKVLYGIADPTSDIGTEGDIYIKYV
jgi:hypothetical protein